MQDNYAFRIIHGKCLRLAGLEPETFSFVYEPATQTATPLRAYKIGLCRSQIGGLVQSDILSYVL